VLKEIENDLNLNSGDETGGGGAGAGGRTSYYVEENERMLNMLITNCEPILQEIV
jgi:hypothetical protein